MITHCPVPGAPLYTTPEESSTTLTPGQIPPERLAEIKALRFEPPHDTALGVYDTDTERELYRLAVNTWAALQDLIRDHDHLTAANAAAAEEIATWTGALAR